MIEKHYEVVIVGGGITGAALMYELARYTDIKSMAIIEKYEGLATLNSKGVCNSQTIHCGDIETNYTLDKASKVKRKAQMVIKYCLLNGYNEKFLFQSQKIAMGVGDEEVETIKKHFEEFKPLYPYLELYDKNSLKEMEPRIIFDENGNERPENVVAMGTKDGTYTTIDFGALTNALVNDAKKEGKETDVYLNSEVEIIEKVGDKFYIRTKNKLSISADFVVVDAGAHSLWLARKMGYGKNMGCLCVAGSFYLTKQKLLNGKVYMVQNPKLPFAALHGDPDILANGCTRFGPTALPMPKLERYHGLKSVPEFFQTLNLDTTMIKIVWDLIKDEEIRNYLLSNVLYEVPGINKKFFIKGARKIVPSLRESDIYYADGFGGVRPQIVDKKEKKLLFGEASINSGQGIIFNMTPSPGATSCFGGAEKDARTICKYLNKKFDDVKFNSELTDE